MQKSKYYLLNIATVALFSFICATTINQIIKSYLTVYPANIKKSISARSSDNKNINADINKIAESGLFRISTSSDVVSNDQGQSQLSDLKLLGTVTGPSSIARALILKKGEKQAEIFRLWKDVYGFTLVGIESSRVYLKQDKSSLALSLYEKKEISPVAEKKPDTGNEGSAKKSISRAEFQQKMLNNIDNAMQGVKAGPHRVNGEIVGFQLIRIRPYNVLYEYGLRSGDIIKRINGKKIDSTEKLYNMWQGFKNESKLTFDLERSGKIVTIDVNITD